MDNTDPNHEFTRPTLAGNLADDDGVIFDTLFEPDPEPPTPKEIADDIGGASSEMRTPKRGSRLVTGSIMIDAVYNAPTLILPADPYRKSLSITAGCTSSTTDGFLFLASSADSLAGVITDFVEGNWQVDYSFYSGAFAWRSDVGSVPFVIPDYDGPLYVRTTQTAGKPKRGIWFVSWLAVTE